MRLITGVVTAGLLAAASASASAADKLRIGYIATASGAPTTSFSKEMRSGFDVALKQLNGQLGGLPVEVFSGDDQGNPEIGKQMFDRMVKRDKVDIVTGVVASGVVNALAPLASQQKVFFVNSNVGPRDFVAAKCSAYYFNTGWHIESVNEAMGRYLSGLGFKKVYLVAVGVPVGREHLDAFKRTYTGSVAGERYYKPQTLDFSTELADIRAAQPDAVYSFAFGPLAVNFAKQYAQAGLKEIPLFGPAPTADEETIGGAGDAVVGVTTAGHWNLDLPQAANTKFRAEFEKEYKRPPAIAAEQGYTTALVIDAAVRAVGGKVEDKDAFRKALESVSLDTPRGPFKFGVDHSPVQNVYLRKVVKGDKDEAVNRTQKVIATSLGVRGAEECRFSEPGAR